MPQENKMIPTNCTICAKPVAELKVLSRVELKVDCYYARPDETFESMNGLGRHTEEYLCETCFSKFVDTLEKTFAPDSKQ